LVFGAHFDSKTRFHQDARMRTTVTLDKEVERMLRDAMHRSGKSFKEAVKAALPAGLSGKPVGTQARQFVVEARPMGLRAGFDPAGFNRLADDFKVEASTEKQARAGQP
jgi:hypothetical protein